MRRSLPSGGSEVPKYWRYCGTDEPTRTNAFPKLPRSVELMRS